MHIDYFSPARLDDEITIAAYFSNIGRTSVTMNIDLLRDDRKTVMRRRLPGARVRGHRAEEDGAAARVQAPRRSVRNVDRRGAIGVAGSRGRVIVK